MIIRSKTLAIMNLIYCYIPCLLFLSGWCRPLISIPASLLLVLACCQFVKGLKTSRQVQIGKTVFWVSLAVSLAVCILSGMGGMFAHFYDYPKHRMVIQDLTVYDWPVVYHERETAMLTYYIGQYLLPALIGKVFNNSIIAEVMMGVFGWIGVYLLYINMVIITEANNKKKQLWLVALFFLFSGMMMPLKAVEQLLVTGSFKNALVGQSWAWYIVRGNLLQYRCALTSIKWVFPQYIVPCLGVSMIALNHRNFKHSALFILPSMICGTWGFICSVMLVTLNYAISCIKSRKVDLTILSIWNIMVAAVGLVFLSYYWGNVVCEKPSYMYLSFIKKPSYYVWSYLPFVLFMFGIYVLLIWRESKSEILFLSIVVILVIVPCFRMGYFNDWVLGVSMPALFLLSCFVSQFLFTNSSTFKRFRLRKTVLSACLVLALWSPWREMQSSLRFMNNPISYPKKSLARYADRSLKFEDNRDAAIMKYNYFTYDHENTFFYKHLARRRPTD